MEKRVWPPEEGRQNSEVSAQVSERGLQTSNVGLAWEPVRDGESWASSQTPSIRICIFTSSPGDASALSFPSTGMMKGS